METESGPYVSVAKLILEAAEALQKHVGTHDEPGAALQVEMKGLTMAMESLLLATVGIAEASIAAKKAIRKHG